MQSSDFISTLTVHFESPMIDRDVLCCRWTILYAIKLPCPALRVGAPSLCCKAYAGVPQLLLWSLESDLILEL